MIPIGTHGLDCPDSQDYAALALYMQCFAETVDELLTAQLAATQSFMDRPTIICINLANRSVPALGTSYNVFDTVAFNNSTFMSLVVDPSAEPPSSAVPVAANYIRIGSAPGTVPAVPYPRGLYMVGGYTAQTAAGAVTGYSFRSLNFEVVDQTSPTFDVALFGQEDMTFETSTGGNERQIVKFPVHLTGESGVQVFASSSNTNVPSAVNVLANSFFWVTYVGPSDLVEVA